MEKEIFVRATRVALPKNWQRIQGREGVLRWLKDWSFIRNGLDSGYHPCCIMTYKVRTLLMDLWAWAFNSQWLFNPNRHRHARLSWNPDNEAEVKAAEEYRNSLECQLRRPGYVQCYFHKVLMHAQQKPVKWYHCEKCRWGQIRFSTCRRCK